MSGAMTMLGVASLGSCAAFGQLLSRPPKFDVASVKTARGPVSSNGYNHQISPLGITMYHVSMGYCIRLAYGLQRSYELVGPAWIDPPTENLFDIEAKVDSPIAADRMKLMLQSLLEERFKLVAHREDRNLPAYVLLRGTKPRPIKISEDATPTRVLPGEQPYELTFEHVSMAQLAQQLGPPMTSRPVVDKTGLPGSFDFKLDLTRYILDASTGQPVLDAHGAVDTEGATIRAVPDQLGLILKPGHAPISVLIVDRVEKIPSSN